MASQDFSGHFEYLSSLSAKLRSGSCTPPQAADLLENAVNELTVSLSADSGAGISSAESTLTEGQELYRSVAESTEERERRNLATQLHDGPGQLLSLAAIKLTTLEKGTPPVNNKEQLAEVAELVAQAERATRSLTFQIYPPALHDLGFAAGAEWLAEDIERLYGLKVQLTDDGSPLALGEPVSVVLFQCLREVLVNVAKHAGVKDVKVHVSTQDHGVHVTIEDEGAGFDTKDVTARDRGFGLFSIRERLRQLGGKLEIKSRQGKGTTVYLDAPKES